MFTLKMSTSSTSQITVSKALPEDFDLIKQYIKQFELDDRKLSVHEFVVAKENDCLLGFGRIRKHNGCDEFCSLGVIEPERSKGIAQELIKARIKLATQPIYLVCIIPEFFEPLGFEIVDVYPPEIQDKLNYCTSELVVPEPYVVMKYNGSNT